MVALSMPANGPLSDPFGPRNNVPFSPIHHGQDIGFYVATYDMRIFAAAPGTVVAVYYNWALGNCIEIRHADGTETQYCHLADSGLVNVGDTVSRRQHIGTMGSTGSQAVVGGVRQTHLHFVYIINGVRVDPIPYMTGTAGGGTPIDEEEDEDMAKVYERGVNSGKFGLGWGGGWYDITDEDGVANIRAVLTQAFGAPIQQLPADYDNIRRLLISTMAPGGTVAGTFTPADRARLQAVPTALQNGQAARAEIVK